MRQLDSASRGRYARWVAALLTLPALLVGVSACGGSQAPPPVKVIADRAPYGDLLVPELSASVKDGAVDVAVDQPVTVRASSGVRSGRCRWSPMPGPRGRRSAEPDGVTWSTTDPLDYNKRYTISAKSLGWAVSPRRRWRSRPSHPRT